MTREERYIAVLNRMLENMDVYDSIQPTTERKKAIKAAIKALSQEPCDDAISRQAVINAIENDCMRGGLGSCFASYDDAQKFRGEIEKLPPVTQKSGKWIDSSNGWMCSACNKDNTYDTNFCPNCGAKMESEE